MKVIYGNELAESIKKTLKDEVDVLKLAGKRLPHLTVILVGDNPASQSYVKGKEKACVNIGIGNYTIRLSGTITQKELMNVIREQNADPNVDGILIQLPLPEHLNEEEAIMAIDPSKDVDGLHPINAGNLLTGRPGFIPCTPKGVMAMLESIGLDDLSGYNAVVCGRSNLVGKPISLLLQNKNATVTMVHSKTKDMKLITSQADILIAAVGKAKMIKADWVKEEAVVIDVGINRNEEGKLVGDVDFDEVSKKVSAISPVPKGVGPMTVCMLLSNTIEAYKYHERGNV